MSFKTYKPRFVRSFLYTDEDGTREEIVFMANGYLFPLYKSYTGVELTKALDDYSKELVKLIDNDALKAVMEYDNAEGDGKLEAVLENKNAFAKLFGAAFNADNVGGMSLTETLMIVMRVCALPQEDHAAALAAGVELLPQECFDDPELALDLLRLAGDYNAHAKKKSDFQTLAKMRTAR